MSHVMNTYARLPVTFSHGQGCRITDTDGKEYLDALSGIAVSTLGHAHPRLVAAIAAQAGRMLHTSNLYRIAEQEQLADKLCALSGMGGLPDSKKHPYLSHCIKSSWKKGVLPCLLLRSHICACIPPCRHGQVGMVSQLVMSGAYLMPA